MSHLLSTNRASHDCQTHRPFPRHWSWIKGLIGSRSNNTWIVKNPLLWDHRGRPAYTLLSMFKAILPGQWHSLSDPELEHSLITRIDFNLFCRFDELSIPDYSTLCHYRNWLARDDTLSELLERINRQLTEKGPKIEKASAVAGNTIIQTASSKQRQP